MAEIVKHKGEGHRKRLRERFLKSGLQGFHDYEVLELLLSLNTPRKDCKQSAKELLKKFKSLPAVMEAMPEELTEIKGVGPANCLGIRLIREVAERYLKAKLTSRDVVKNPEDLLAYLKHSICHKTQELFAAIFLDAGNRVLASEILFKGTLTTSAVYPREVIIKALKYNCVSVIFAHNHPSGDAKPSKSDIKITKKLFYALKYVDILLHEHIIMADDKLFSFAAEGIIAKWEKEFKDDIRR